MLYLISTPIGNLGDLSLRAIETMRQCSVIFCEDTRLSKRLMQAHDIDTPLISYHKFNEQQKLTTIIKRLKNGEEVALISDAGTPLIADPGNRLVAALHKENLPMTTVPGPSAFLSAIILSGLTSDPFQFIGFLEKKRSALLEQITSLMRYEGSTAALLSPHSLIETLQSFEKLLPEHPLFIARELTKKFEEYVWGTPHELIKKWTNNLIKGEFVIIIPKIQSPLSGDPLALVKHLQEQFSLTKKEALIISAKHFNLSKRTLYNRQNK